MKIFGFSAFEPSDYKKFKAELDAARLEEVIKGCKDDNYLSWEYRDLDMVADIVYSDGWSDHKKLVQKKECHKFNGKKYCYHTGIEIVIEL